MQLSFALSHQFLLMNDTHHSHNFEWNIGSTARPITDGFTVHHSPSRVKFISKASMMSRSADIPGAELCKYRIERHTIPPRPHLHAGSLWRHNRIWAWRCESVTCSTVAFEGKVARICSPLYSIPSLSAVPRGWRMRSGSDQCFNSLPPIGLSSDSNEFVAHIYLPT